MTVFCSDSFTATAGTALESRPSDSGNTWVKNTAGTINGGTGFTITPSGDVIENSDNATGNLYTLNATPPSANYAVSCTVDLLSALSAGSTIGIAARAQASVDTGYYFVFVQGTGFVFVKRVAGTATIIGLTYTSGTIPTVGTPFTMELDVNGNTLTGRLNGSVVNTTTDSAIAAAGFPGILIAENGTAPTATTKGHVRAFSASTLTNLVSVSSPATFQTFQRSGTTANIPISGTNSDVVAHPIEASFNGGPFQTIASSVAAGATFSGTLSAQAQGQGTLTVRFVDAPTNIATVGTVGIGDIYVIAGQSNAVGQVSTNQTAFHQSLVATTFGLNYVWAAATDPLASSTGQVDSVPNNGTYNNGGQPSGYGGTYWMALATSLMASTGVPVAFIMTAQDGAGLASAQSGTGYQWVPIPGSRDRTKLYGAMVYRALQSGGVKGVLWHLGETDAINGVSQAAHASALIAFGQAVSTDLGVPVTACKFQHCTAGSPTSAAQLAINNAIAQAAQTGGSNIILGPDLSTMTATSTDGLHLFN